MDGVNKVDPAIKSAVSAVDGLAFAEVDDDVATLVKNSAAGTGANLKVMAAGAPAIVLASIGDEITVDTTLAAVTVTTTATDAYVDGPVNNTYTVVEKSTPTITVTLDPEIVEYSDQISFPIPTVTGADNYETTWSPTAIT